MGAAIEQLAAARQWDRTEALTAIADAVWSVTMVDAALVRHRPDAYDHVMASRSPAERRLIEETMAGLRFVRNRIGDAELWQFVESGGPGAATGIESVSDWTWKSVQEPGLAGLSSRAQAWEIARHRGYQARLAGRTTGETLGRAAAFLRQAAANTSPATDVTHARRPGR